MQSLGLRGTYDPEVDAGYIYFDDIAPGEAKRQHVVEDWDDGPTGRAMILDIAEDGRLLGIELLNVHRLVARPQILES